MSVVGHRVNATDFRKATGLKPVVVTFSDGSTAEYYRVASIEAESAIVQEKVATFIAHCARARLAKRSKGLQVPELDQALKWEPKLSPEATGEYGVGARDAITANRQHAEVWKALCEKLAKWRVDHTNERVNLYGPDLYTFGNAPKALFEIKTKLNSSDIFEAVGQLQIYDVLLEGGYRRIFVAPKGIGQILAGSLSNLNILTVEYWKEGREIRFDTGKLRACLRP
jgi:hypothetical protein